MRWDYYSVKTNLDQHEDYLRTGSVNGWELVSAVPICRNGYTEFFQLIFKRPRT